MILFFLGGHISCTFLSRKPHAFSRVGGGGQGSQGEGKFEGETGVGRPGVFSLPQQG